MGFRWKIRQKLTAGLALVVSMIALLSGGAFYGLYSYRHSNKTFDYHNRQLELLGHIRKAIEDLTEKPEPGFEADGNGPPILLQRLATVAETLRACRTNLESGISGNLASRQASNQQETISQLTDSVSRLREKVAGVSGADGAWKNNFLLPTDDIRKLVEDLRTKSQVLQGHIHREITANILADKNSYRTCMGIVYSTSILVVAMLGLFVWLGYRSILHPFRMLHRGVAKLARGNFDSHVTIRSGDELQELGDAFNDMADHLQTMYRELNRQVEDRSRQLIRSERLASVGFLAAGVAHEINNPLASIAFCGEALESRLRQLLPTDDRDVEVVHNYLNMIQQEAFRCKAITEKLLNFSRAGAPERIDADIVALIREVMELVQHLGRTGDRTLEFEPTEPVFCRVNPQELKQVLLNLVVNALDNTDEGGRVTLQARNVGEQVAITVRDDGCGMTPEVLENLFEPFFTRNRTGKGTGLGLSISHLIVSQHGGALEADSEGPGKGSTFTVRLPQRSAARLAA